MIDLTDRLDMDTRTITVLDDPPQIESVLRRYERKGWRLAGALRDRHTQPATITLHLHRPATGAHP
jgi:hypothetical protein